MAAMPQSFAMARSLAKKKKQKRNEGESQGPNMGVVNNQGYTYNIAKTDDAARYNTKMMNSIWGMYNQNSVHNIKSHQNQNETAASTAEVAAMESESVAAHGMGAGFEARSSPTSRKRDIVIQSDFQGFLNQYNSTELFKVLGLPAKSSQLDLSQLDLMGEQKWSPGLSRRAQF